MSTNTRTQAQVYRERQIESLRRTLGDDILGYLQDPVIIEIMLNQDGNIWVDVLGGDMEIPVPDGSRPGQDGD
jgi:hypothetical protein